MGKVIGWLKEIPLIHKLVMIFITVVVSVFLSGAYLSGLLDLPDGVDELRAQVTVNTNAIHEIQDQHRSDRNLMLRMLCNQDPRESWESCELRYGGGGVAPGR